MKYYVLLQIAIQSWLYGQLYYYGEFSTQLDFCFCDFTLHGIMVTPQCCYTEMLVNNVQTYISQLPCHLRNESVLLLVCSTLVIYLVAETRGISIVITAVYSQGYNQ
jgi:hypothetical protein